MVNQSPKIITVSESKDEYEDEVIQRWGDSPAYAQSKERTSKYSHKFFSFTRPPLINETFDLKKKCKKLGIKPEEYWIVKK